jgi:protein SCO1/2
MIVGAIKLFGPRIRTVLKAVLISTLILSIPLAQGYTQIVKEDPQELNGIDIQEHLSEKIPLDLTFTGDDGRQVKLAEFFNAGQPVIMVLGYYTCPMLCNLVFNGLRDAMNEMSFMPGKDFRVVTISIDPRETDVIAAAKKKNYLSGLNKPGITGDAWAFLTGEEDRSRALANALGFEYYYDEREDQYAHPAVIFVLTGDGTISRYFYGISFKERDLRFALMDASEGKVGSALDRVILYCYHYDPKEGNYSLFAGNLMRLGGAVTLFFLIVILGILWFRERHRKISGEVQKNTVPDL